MSSDESSDSYGGRRPRRSAAKRGRKAKRGTYRDDYGGSGSGTAKVKLKVKTGGAEVTGKRGVKGGYTITNVSGKDANVPPQWQGFADRELDSDTEEPLVFEEAFILRMPVPTNEDQVKELERFSDMVKKREPMDEKDVWFKFLDSRRAVFNLGKTMYNAKLVDLPCLIETQKTHDNKHVFKTADISQMLLVEYPIASEQAAVSSDKPFNIDDYIYPHGLSPPLRNVRRRRFKPRINKQAIEIVERQVERLIEQDEDADEVKYEMVDESEIQEGEQLRTQAEYMAEFAGVDMSLDPALMGAAASTSGALAPTDTAAGDLPPANVTEIDAEGETPAPGPAEGQTPAAATDVDAEGDETGDGEDDDDEDEEEDEDEEDSDAEGYDSDLAAMIEGEIGDTSGKPGATASTAQAGTSTGTSGAQQQKTADKSDESDGSDDSDEDDLFGKGRSDDEDDNVVLGDATVQDNEETLDAKRRIRLMADEMKDLENAVSRKKGEVSRAPNPIIKRRFEDSLKKLTQELEMKKAQHVAAQNRLQHFQNEIKKADAAEKEAAAGPPAPTAEETAAVAAATVSGAPRADPAIVFGEKKKATEKAPTDSRAREDSEDLMQIDRQSPAPVTPAQPNQNTDISTQDIDISVIQEEPEQRQDNDDIQVSMQDISVGDTAGNLDDLFGDDPDE